MAAREAEPLVAASGGSGPIAASTRQHPAPSVGRGGCLRRGLAALLAGAGAPALCLGALRGRAAAAAWGRLRGGAASSAAIGLSAAAPARAAPALEDREQEPRAVTLARFLTNDILNGQYRAHLGSEYVVNGRETYWSKLGYFLYWCPHRNASRSQWLVSWNATFEEIKKTRACRYIAAGPRGAELLNATAVAGWLEWDAASKAMVRRPHAGVEASGVYEELDAAPSSFSALEQWPLCGEALKSRVRTQTQECNNCWAASVAQVLEWRLCIAAPDAFQGPSAFMSVGYITSCARSAYVGNRSTGCDGGSPLAAMRWAASHGVPTGGDANNVRTCVPDFSGGGPADSAAAGDGGARPGRRAAGSMHLPACPTSCTSKGYSRSLEEDLFVPEGWTESWATTSFESATAAIRHSGPIVIGFPVDRHFQASYDPGSIYKHRADDHLFDHFAFAVGYGQNYIEAVNSWGLGWGRLGHFRIHRDSVWSYVIPGSLRGHGQGYPYPLPRHGLNYVVMAGFRRPALNGRYTEVDARKLMINGNRAYMEASNKYLLYWCHVAKRYAIAGTSALPELRKGRACRYWALAPPGARVFGLGADWLELDSEHRHPVVRNGSGIVDSEFSTAN